MATYKEYQAEYYKANKERLREYKKKYYRKNKEEYKNRYLKNEEHIEKIRKKYRESHSKELSRKAAEWAKANKDRVKESRRKRAERMTKDEKDILKATTKIRYSLWYNLRRHGRSKSAYLEGITGCSNLSLYEHLCKTWKDRYGTEWNGQPCHIDHIIPLCTGKGIKEKEKLCHYTNLQLLTPEDNASKHIKLDFCLKI